MVKNTKNPNLDKFVKAAQSVLTAKHIPASIICVEAEIKALKTALDMITDDILHEDVVTQLRDQLMNKIEHNEKILPGRTILDCIGKLCSATVTDILKIEDHIGSMLFFYSRVKATAPNLMPEKLFVAIFLQSIKVPASSGWKLHELVDLKIDTVIDALMAKIHQVLVTSSVDLHFDSLSLQDKPKQPKKKKKNPKPKAVESSNPTSGGNPQSTFGQRNIGVRIVN